MKDSTTSDRLRFIMNSRNLRQTDILELCKPYCERYNVRLAKNDLSQYVSGKIEPKQDKLSILSFALNVSEAWLAGYDVPMERTVKVSSKMSSTSAVRIPVLGRVAAGIPIDAVEYIVDWEEIPTDMSSTGEYFCLQIKGDSMEPKISDGDVVIVRKQEDADTGDLVIALVNGSDATCKRLMKYTDGIALISTNPKYAPLQYSNREIVEKPVQIIGKVVELRAKF